jgi:hypothetical protein
MRSYNFRESDEDNIEWLAKQKIMRTLAELVLTTNTTLYRQWFRGADNIVADSLSRDAYFLSNKTHEIFLQHSATLQSSKGFRILPVPKEICCFDTSVLLPLPVKQHWLMQQKPSKLAH